MFNPTTFVMTVGLIAAIICSPFGSLQTHETEYEQIALQRAIEEKQISPKKTIKPIVIKKEVTPKAEPLVMVEEPEVEILSDTYVELTQEEIELIALVTMGEAEGEPEEGKRLVIDTILNRVDSEYFPDTVHEVIYQPNQFECMWNGRLDRCDIREEIVELVKEEAESRTNSDVVFFRTQRYHSYGDPLFQVGNHYFSSYE